MTPGISLVFKIAMLESDCDVVYYNLLISGCFQEKLSVDYGTRVLSDAVYVLNLVIVHDPNFAYSM